MALGFMELVRAEGVRSNSDPDKVEQEAKELQELCGLFSDASVVLLITQNFQRNMRECSYLPWRKLLECQHFILFGITCEIAIRISDLGYFTSYNFTSVTATALKKMHQDFYSIKSVMIKNTEGIYVHLASTIANIFAKEHLFSDNKITQNVA